MEHLSLVVIGHVDSGKSTTTGRLYYELMKKKDAKEADRNFGKLQSEADAEGKSSFAYAYLMDTSKEERKRGVTINSTSIEMYTESKQYTIIDAPGHRDFIKNMISGASQADLALVMVPADGNFVTAIQKGNHKLGEVQGQTRQHARLINLLGVKQIFVGINKMDCDVALYGKERFDECANEAKDMLIKVGWKKDFVTKSVPFLPISGFKGDNLVEESKNMSWFSGSKYISLDGREVHCKTVYDCLEKFAVLPPRQLELPFRLPVSSIMSIKGVGIVGCGMAIQGSLDIGAEVKFLPTHTAALPCTGKVFSAEQHHKRLERVDAGYNVGINIKNLDKNNMPRVGDVMVLKSDNTLKPVSSFVCQIQCLDIPNCIKVNYTPICFVRTARAPGKIVSINWKMGKETNGQKVPNATEIKSGDVAEIEIQPTKPLVVESFKSCEGLSRVAFLDGNTAVMLGKVISVVEKTV